MTRGNGAPLIRYLRRIRVSATVHSAKSLLSACFRLNFRGFPETSYKKTQGSRSGHLTLSSDDRQSQSGGEDKPLGWISDAQGIPCVSGERKTNAPAFLSQRIGVMAIQAAGQAAAAAETTSVIGDSGSVTNSVTGDTGTYVLGKTVAGGSDEVAKWLLERQSQSFDAVFVPAGTRLAIHVDRELPIDLNPSGRRLQHATAPAGHSRHRLD